MSYYEQLEKMKGQMRVANIGVANDRKAYQKVTGDVGGVPLLGPYRIRSDEWESLSAQAGVSGARWQDGNAQEAVMSFVLTQLYNDLDGRWDGVAVAWQAGSDAARRVIDGEAIGQVFKGEGATAIQGWVDDVIGPLTDVPPDPNESAQAATYNGPFQNATLVSSEGPTVQQTADPMQAVTGRLAEMRDRQVGQREQEQPEMETEEVIEDGSQGS